MILSVHRNTIGTKKQYWDEKKIGTKNDIVINIPSKERMLLQLQSYTFKETGIDVLKFWEVEL